ncbi:hypothetical protein [Dipodfec virus UA06Rod_16]|uniref:Uncharacterized protein n=1 Tax=Dipodfec virus UA06Rod_16 TaxID=2929317 RepID=A0A976N1L8_9VIRU|nr:hypothetical protein [Dipodfec virus UA06Rod_16]
MKRYNASVGSSFCRFGLKNPHRLNRISGYRGGTRL